MLEHKLTELKQKLSAMESAVVAYSGGIDSTFLAKIAYDCLGDRAVAMTAVSPSLAPYEQQEAEEIAKQIGIRHILFESHEMDDPNYLQNASNRCYFCKSNVFNELVDYAHNQGFRYILDGSNADDEGDHRPGRIAAREKNVRSPLQEVQLTKSEIRELARQHGLPNWNKPAAACLASRIPYGTTIHADMLTQVWKAEKALRKLGFLQLRVRHHDKIARIEVEPKDFPRVLQHRDEILKALKATGYSYITLDLAGFRSGSMNEVLSA